MKLDMTQELNYQQIRRICMGDFGCKITDELPALETIIGQDRAVKALQFGLNIEETGFNIYVSGYPGTGRETASVGFVSEVAEKKPRPSDWCYVYNFDDSYRPRAIELPLGKGREFKEDMRVFIENVKKALARAFESEDYGHKRDAIVADVENERRDVTEKIDAAATQRGFSLQRTQVGIVIVPLYNGKPLRDEDFQKLPEARKKEIEQKKLELDEELRSSGRLLRDLERKADSQIEDLDRNVALYAMENLLNGMLEKYGNLEKVKVYLDETRDDITRNLSIFLETQEETPRPQLPFVQPKVQQMKRYEVNLVVDNSKTQGAPVIVELNPTYPNLFGSIEKEAQFGALITDFTLIRAGSMHRANGGYIVMHAEDLLSDPLSWETLKRALTNGSLVVEDVIERLGLMTTKTLRPEPIPLKTKVILIGNPDLYYALYQLDRSFHELFKVKADFDVTMNWNDQNLKEYASFVCSVCKKENLLPLDSEAMAEVIEYSSRLAEDQMKLSTRFSQISDLIREASFYAKLDGKQYVERQYVTRALEEKIYRSNLIQERIKEMIARGQLFIDTDGAKVGQVNGLAVVGLGDFEFGQPSRITATVALGKEEIIDIERESELGGKIHTKGILILAGYLSEKYAQNAPLSLSARLVFEQSYGGIEGDSASSTELYALLSAASEQPVKQYLAVTGSVNQKGDVQPIGGVNYKIEGFYEICKAKGFTGKQGIVIPYSNIQNLMLKAEVVQAVREGQFHIYAVKAIDEGIEVLTGMKAGARTPDGSYEEGTINDLIQKRLQKMAAKLKEYST